MQDRKQGCLESFFLDKKLGEAEATAGGGSKKNHPHSSGDSRRSQLRRTVEQCSKPWLVV